jgi:hypothetical protein
MQFHGPQPPKTLLMQALQSDSTDGAEGAFDSDRYTRAETLLAEAQRRGPYREDAGSFSAGYTLEVAAQRYFELLNVELLSLQGFLTESELVALLNTTASPVWDWRAGFTLAGILADDQGIESLEDDTLMGRFVRKLSTLTHSQCVALVDACERIWRGLGAGSESLASSAERCGLHLARS